MRAYLAQKRGKVIFHTNDKYSRGCFAADKHGNMFNSVLQIPPPRQPISPSPRKLYPLFAPVPQLWLPVTKENYSK